MLHKVSRTPDDSVRAGDDGHIEAPFIHPHQRAWDSMNAEDQEAVTQVFANAGKSIAAFERQIVSRRAPFDIFVEGLRENDESKLAALGPAERRGLSVFLSRAHCHVCHSGPAFTDREFHDIRVPLRAEAAADPGRQQGIEIVRRSPFNGVGPHSDAPTSEVGRKVDYLPWHVHEQAEFKTPTLRNVAVTAPYMHQGQFATLDEVVRFYSSLEGAAESSTTETILLPLNLEDGEIADLVAFLASLTDAPLALE
jgi:cytochrome c peroxidase